MPDLRVAFIGPCHTTGYPGVSADESFPGVARRAVEAVRPGLRVRILNEPCYHPADYPRAARSVRRKHPALAVIEAVGWFAIAGSGAVDLGRLPPGVRSGYDRVRHLRHVAAALLKRWPATQSVVIRVDTAIAALAEGPLRTLLPRLPRPTLAEYEARLDGALAELRAGGIAVVVQGPGLLSDQLDYRRLPADAADRYAAVNRLARAVAQRHHALFVDRFDATPGIALFYFPGSIRPSPMGHHAWGQLLADRLLEAGIV